jgi:putative toxin-antitoxin system antitoxin component (TIGR02293 family)
MQKPIKKEIKVSKQVSKEAYDASNTNSFKENKGKTIQPSIKSSKVKLYEVEDGIEQWLGESVHLYKPIRSDFDVISIGLSGITKASVDELARNLGVSRKSMAEDILDVSVKTLERKAAIDKLDKKTSSHALEIARVMHHAYQVFEAKEKVKLWLNYENKALNGTKPIDLLGTLTGLNMVNDILSRIEEGVYS